MKQINQVAAVVAFGVFSAFGGETVFTGSFWKPDGFYGDGRVPSADHLKTPDRPPHGHILAYTFEAPKTGWYAPFFKGGAPEQDYFIDDAMIAQARSGGREGTDGFAQGPAFYLSAGKHVLRLERPGRRGFPMQKFETVEIRALAPSAENWFFADKEGHDVIRVGETVKFAVTAGLVDSPVEYEFRVAEQNGPDARRYFPLAKLVWPATAQPLKKVVEMKLPKEGMYFVQAFVNGKPLPSNAFPRFEVVAIEVNDHGADTADFKLEKLVDIDCVKQPPDAEANGQSASIVRGKLAYRESHDCSQTTDKPFDGNSPENLSCFAYRVKVPAAQVPYLLEVDYPDDARRSACVRHDWMKEGTKEYLRGNQGYQTKSYETGGFFPISGKMKTQGQLIWPLSTEGYITIINQSAGTRAAAARIRLSRFHDDRIPAQGDTSKHGRSFAYWSEEGDSFGIMLGAGSGVNFGGESIPYLEAARRWFQMIRFYGGNAMNGCGFAYQGAYWNSKALKGVGIRPFSALRMFALLGEKYRMSFVPEWFNQQWFMDRVTYPERAGGSENSQARNASGSYVGGGVNVLCPAVQATIIAAMGEIHDELADSPAFKGLTVRADAWQFRGEFFYKSLYWGYNEAVVRAFEKETGLTVPQGSAADYFKFLTAPERKARWIAWRCAKVEDFHRRILAALRGETRKDLFFGMAGQFDQENLYAPEATLAERALGSGVDSVKYRTSDGFSIIPVSRYGSRTPSLGDRRIYDEFFRSDSTEGGMCTPRAFGSYMTYMELGTDWPAAKLGFDLKAKGGRPPYHCSGVIAAGRAGLEKYAVVLAEQDTAYFREGGNADCFGSPDIFGPWLAAYERIPAEKFERVAGKNDPVAVWQRTIDGRLWYYAVNKESFATTATVVFSDGTQRTIDLEPWGLQVFDEAAKRTLVSAESVYPESERAKVRQLLAEAQALSGTIRDSAYAAQLTRAWAAAEAGRWWRTRVLLNEAVMYRGYAAAGKMPAEVLRTPFPDKLDTQSPKNGHWNLCTPTKTAALLALSNVKLVDSRQLNDQWRGEKVLWSEAGALSFTLKVPAEGHYDLVLGAIGAEAGVATASVDGKLLPDVCRFAKAKIPMTASFRNISLKPGVVTVKLSAAAGVGVYGVRFLPVMRPIPGTDWVVSGPYPKTWAEGAGKGDAELKLGFDELMKTDLAQADWKYAVPGVRDSLWDRGVQMPLRISSTGSDRLIARTTIMSERARTATLIIAVDWWCRATLNGELVKTDVVGGGSEKNGCSFWGWYPMYTGVIKLKPGANDLVLYVNGGSLGSAICGWISGDDDLLTTAHLPRTELALTNGKAFATVDATLGGRVLAFGRAGGRNWLWRNEAAREFTGERDWKNIGGEKTWVGTIGDWVTQFGRKVGWPPPKWFDGSAFSVERESLELVELRSRPSPGDFWKAQLRRQVSFENESLVIKSSVETLAPTEETSDRMWNWSVTQVPEAKRLAVHLVGRQRMQWGHTKGEAVKPIGRSGDWVYYDFADFGINGLMNYDADAIAAEYEDGWLLVQHRADPKTIEPFEKPRCAVFHSGFQKSMKGDRSKQYIELEFLCYGPDTTMEVVLNAVANPETLARSLVDKMTLEEKVSQTCSDAPAIPRLGLPAYEWWGEALHGVARAGSASVFPQSIGRAATFDVELEKRIGRAIGTEARAKYNLFQLKGYRGRYAGLTLWNPNVNMFRDPRWGRGQETYGEDPFLSGILGSALVEGMQGDDPQRLLTAACAKHYCVHSGPEPGRRAFNAKISERDLREYYLPAFERLVKVAKVEDVMTCYNRVNGESVSASARFIEGILRGEWNHRGYVSSDYGAIEALFEDHHLADHRGNTAAAAIAAGVDLCAGWDYTNLVDSVRKGWLSDAALTRSVERLMTTRARLGILPGQAHHRYDELGAESVDSPEHRALALKCAEESIVLIKNRNHLLPLDRERIAHLNVAGPLGMDEFVLYGNYNGFNSRMTTVVGGLCEVGGPAIRFRHEDGCEVSGKNPPNLGFGWDGADCNAFIACLGYTAALEGEEGSADSAGGNGDRCKFSLPGRQLEMLQQLRKIAGQRPVIAVIFGGSPINLREVEQYADAVLLTWYPGEEGGSAIAKVIFGDVNPSGRLPFTIPNSYEELPDFRDYSLAGRTYLYATKQPQYPFGYGLSYTEFSYANAKVEPLAGGKEWKVSVAVSNVGKRSGDEVVQVYVRSPAGAGDRRRHHLAGFTRVHLTAGETREVVVKLPASAFCIYDERGQRQLPQGESTVFIGGGQPDFANTVSVAVAVR